MELALDKSQNRSQITLEKEDSADESKISESSLQAGSGLKRVKVNDKQMDKV